MGKAWWKLILLLCRWEKMWPANGYNPPQWPKTSPPTGWGDEKPLERIKEGKVVESCDNWFSMD
jgi:hypothetical protein